MVLNGSALLSLFARLKLTRLSCRTATLRTLCRTATAEALPTLTRTAADSLLVKVGVLFFPLSQQHLEHHTEVGIFILVMSGI